VRVFEFDHDPDAPRTLELTREAVETEWQLESWLHANPEVILNEPLLIFGRQYGLDTGIPDLLALDQWGNVVTPRGFVLFLIIVAGVVMFGQALVSDFDEVVPEDEEG